MRERAGQLLDVHPYGARFDVQDERTDVGPLRADREVGLAVAHPGPRRQTLALQPTRRGAGGGVVGEAKVCSTRAR